LKLLLFRIRNFNSYEYQTPEDFIYYVLFVMEQLKMDPREQLIQLAGKIDEHSDLYKTVYKFIRNVHVLNLHTLAQTLSVIPEQLEQHYILLQL